MTARGRRGGRGLGFGAHRGILKRGEGVVGEGARWRGGPQHAIYVLSVEKRITTKEKRREGVRARSEEGSGPPGGRGKLGYSRWKKEKGQGEEKERAQGEVKVSLLIFKTGLRNHLINKQVLKLYLK
jgi:hypothetical protein